MIIESLWVVAAMKLETHSFAFLQVMLGWKRNYFGEMLKNSSVPDPFDILAGRRRIRKAVEGCRSIVHRFFQLRT